jgi:hypothetical protein
MDENDYTHNVYALLYVCSHLIVTFTCICHMLSKIYSISFSAIFLAKVTAAMTYGVTNLKSGEYSDQSATNSCS